MNEELFQATAVILWLAAWSAAAVLRLGTAEAPQQARGFDGRLLWRSGWSVVRGAGIHDPSAVAWGGASLTAAWLALVAFPDGWLRPDAIPGLSISGVAPWIPSLGLLLLSDLCSRQARGETRGTAAPWQGWCAAAAWSAPAAWGGLTGTGGDRAEWSVFWLPAAAAVWLLACTADLHSVETDPGLSRLAGVLRRWLLFGLGIVVFWGGGRLPGVSSISPTMECLVLLGEILALELLLSLAVWRWRKGTLSPEVWLIATLIGLAGGPLTIALIDGLGKDRLLVALSQWMVLVCGVLIARRFARLNSGHAAGDSRRTVR